MIVSNFDISCIPEKGEKMSPKVLICIDAAIIGIGCFADNWYQLIVVYTVGKNKFSFLLPKVNKHESGFCFW